MLVDKMKAAGIIPGIKVDKGLTMIPGTEGESSTQVRGIQGSGRLSRDPGWGFVSKTRFESGTQVFDTQKITRPKSESLKVMMCGT